MDMDICKISCKTGNGYIYNGFVATHAVGNNTVGYTLLVHIKQRASNELSKEHNDYI